MFHERTTNKVEVIAGTLRKGKMVTPAILGLLPFTKRVPTCRWYTVLVLKRIFRSQERWFIVDYTC